MVSQAEHHGLCYSYCLNLCPQRNVINNQRPMNLHGAEWRLPRAPYKKERQEGGITNRCIHPAPSERENIITRATNRTKSATLHEISLSPRRRSTTHRLRDSVTSGGGHPVAEPHPPRPPLPRSSRSHGQGSWINRDHRDRSKGDSPKCGASPVGVTAIWRIVGTGSSTDSSTTGKHHATLDTRTASGNRHLEHGLRTTQGNRRRFERRTSGDRNRHQIGG